MPLAAQFDRLWNANMVYHMHATLNESREVVCMPCMLIQTWPDTVLPHTTDNEGPETSGRSGSNEDKLCLGVVGVKDCGAMQSL